MTLAATGAAGLLKANPALFAVVRVSGRRLSGLGGREYAAAGAWRAWRQRQLAEVSPARAVNAANPLCGALVISLMNPKAILFLCPFSLQFVDPNYAYPALTFAILGGILQCFSALYLTTIIIAGARLADAFRRRRKLAARCLAPLARCLSALAPSWPAPA